MSKTQVKLSRGQKYKSQGDLVRGLQKKYPRFIYEKYSHKISGNNLEIFFDFCIEPSAVALRVKPNIHFKPKIIIENIDRNLLKLDFNKIDNLIFHLGLMEIPSYWKATCSPEIIIKAGSLNSEQIKWWKDLIIKGMGQFFYENKINFKKPNFFTIECLNVKIPSNLLKSNLLKSNFNRFNGVLVPVGGGKDSAVTLELLSSFAKASEDKENIQCFSLNPTGAALKTMKVAGCKPRTRTPHESKLHTGRASSVRSKNPIIVRRKIDEKLLELNRRGFLNGHTPFSAYLAFLSVLAAAIFGNKYVALSNERSSNEGNVKYLGRIINHQWSKSFEFEQKFRNYCKRYLTPPSLPLRESSVIEYFSFLRPLYEIQIAKLFGKYPKYFPVFLSCNEAYKTASGTKLPANPVQIASRLYGARKWCGSCPKCLFVFTALYPFIEEKKIIKIFGKNLFEDPEGKPSASYGAGKNLLPIMQQLIGEKGFKPFECVGTKKESLIAFYLSYKKYIGVTYIKLPFLLKYFEEKILPKYPNLEKESKKIMNSWNKNNNLPKGFKKIIKI